MRCPVDRRSTLAKPFEYDCVAMNKLIVGGVPEHFNLPWNLVAASNAFRSLGVEVEWRDFPEGTGAMMRAVEANEVDVALVLTEGAVAHIAKNGTTGIIGTWVESPLVWGIHSGPKTQKGPQYPHDARIGISRLGSGSHLMPLVHAQQDRYTEAPKLVEIKTLAGAIEAFANDEIDTFYWERTMTLPQVRAGQMTLDGDFSAPWPAFVAVRAKNSQPHVDAAWEKAITAMKTWLTELLSDRQAFLKLVGERFDLPEEEVAIWFARTVWAPSLKVDPAALQRAAKGLVAAGVLEERVSPQSLMISPGVLGEPR